MSKPRTARIEAHKYLLDGKPFTDPCVRVRWPDGTVSEPLEVHWHRYEVPAAASYEARAPRQDPYVLAEFRGTRALMWLTHLDVLLEGRP